MNRRKIVLATIGERRVMKTRIFGLAVILSLATILGACEGGGDAGGGGTTSTPAATGEPTDAPAATPTATPTATP